MFSISPGHSTMRYRVTPPQPLQQESMKDYEDMKGTFTQAKEWMSDALTRAGILVENLVLAHESASSLVSRIQDLVANREDVEEIQDEILPQLKVIRGLSKRSLMDAGVI